MSKSKISRCKHGYRPKMYPGFYERNNIAFKCVESVRLGNIQTLKFLLNNCDKVDKFWNGDRNYIPIKLPLFAILFGHPELYSDICKLIEDKKVRNNITSDKITHFITRYSVEDFDSIGYSSTINVDSIIFTTETTRTIFKYISEGKDDNGCRYMVSDPYVNIPPYHTNCLYNIYSEKIFVRNLKDYLPDSLIEICCEYLIETLTIEEDYTPGFGIRSKISFVSVRNNNPIHYLKYKKYRNNEQTDEEIFYNSDFNILHKHYRSERNKIIGSKSFNDPILNATITINNEVFSCLDVSVLDKISNPKFEGVVKIESFYTHLDITISQLETRIFYRENQDHTIIFTFGKFYL